MSGPLSEERVRAIVRDELTGVARQISNHIGAALLNAVEVRVREVSRRRTG